MSGEKITDYKNTWFVGDSFELLKNIPDKSVQCVLTDPPYDLERSAKDELHHQFCRICNGVIIVFSPPENQWIYQPDQILFWVKPISTKNTSKNYSRFVEMIFIYGRNVWNCDRHWSQYTNVFMDLVDDAGEHAHRKPPSLIERLIRNHTNQNDIILDPFAGSGVVVDKAIELCRQFVAIDKDPKWSEGRFKRWQIMASDVP